MFSCAIEIYYREDNHRLCHFFRSNLAFLEVSQFMKASRNVCDIFIRLLCERYFCFTTRDVKLQEITEHLRRNIFPRVN